MASRLPACFLSAALLLAAIVVAPHAAQAQTTLKYHSFEIGGAFTVNPADQPVMAKQNEGWAVWFEAPSYPAIVTKIRWYVGPQEGGSTASAAQFHIRVWHDAGGVANAPPYWDMLMATDAILSDPLGTGMPIEGATVIGISDFGFAELDLNAGTFPGVAPFSVDGPFRVEILATTDGPLLPSGFPVLYTDASPTPNVNIVKRSAGLTQLKINQVVDQWEEDTGLSACSTKTLATFCDNSFATVPGAWIEDAFPEAGDLIIEVVLDGFDPTECSVGADCDDANPCTDEVCDAGTCNHPANTAICDDIDPCTVGEQCAAGVCGGGAPVVCDDGDPCHLGACNSLSGACSFVEIEGCGAVEPGPEPNPEAGPEPQAEVGPEPQPEPQPEVVAELAPDGHIWPDTEDVMAGDTGIAPGELGTDSGTPAWFSVHSVTPGFGANVASARLTISGAGFNAETTARVGPYALTDLTLVDGQTLSGTLESNPTVGVYTVYIRRGATEVSLADGYEVRAGDAYADDGGCAVASGGSGAQPQHALYLLMVLGILGIRRSRVRP